MNEILNEDTLLPIIDMALLEDIGSGDVTSDSVFTGTEQAEAYIVAKENGVFCGGPVAKTIYHRIDKSIEVSVSVKEGNTVEAGDEAVTCRGSTLSILMGERTVLNFLQRMCGIATRTRRMTSLIEGTGIQVLDTRKTAPGLRILDKYAVRAGGGTNHRMGLYDMVMIKDNHIAAAGSIKEAVRRVRERHGRKYLVEVEATTLLQVESALMAGADIIMLDNMNTGTIQNAVNMINRRAKIEVSGNVDENRMEELKGLGIDYISVGALTHSVRAFDLSMKFK